MYDPSKTTDATTAAAKLLESNSTFLQQRTSNAKQHQLNKQPETHDVLATKSAILYIETWCKFKIFGTWYARVLYANEILQVIILIEHR